MSGMSGVFRAGGSTPGGGARQEHPRHPGNKNMKKIFFLTLIAVFLFGTAQAAPLRVGTTFSPKQCEYLGVDWKKTYLEVLRLELDIIRLGAYWSEIEKEEGIYDFTALDWQIEKARERGIPVVLAVGIKAPRWPEYFMPDWVIKKARPGFARNLAGYGYVRERAVKFTAEVVERYKEEGIIHYWQVENEPFIRIGRKHWYIGTSLLEEEVFVLRSLDGWKRPLIMTIATYPHWLMRLIARVFTRFDRVRESADLCDIIGINVYPVVGHRMFGFDMRLSAAPEARKKYFGGLVGRITKEGKEVWVTELQAEPWEPGHLAYKGEEVPDTDSPADTEKVFIEMRGLGVDTFLLWGAEYWIFRRERYGDTRWLEMVSGLREKE